MPCLSRVLNTWSIIKIMTSIIILILLSGCSELEKIDSYENYRRLNIDTVYHDIESEFMNNSYNFSYLLLEDSSYLVFSNKQDTSINFYEISKNKWAKRIPLGSYNLPVTVGSCQSNFAICVLSLSEFYILQNETTNGLLLHYKNGSLKPVTHVSKAPRLIHDGFEVHPLTSGYELFHQDNSLYFKIWKTFEEGAKYTNLQYNFPYLAKYNLVTGELGYCGMAYPQIFDSSYFPGIQIEGFLLKDSLLFQHFNCMPDIYRYDMKNKKMDKLSLRSAFQTEDILPLGLNAEGTDLNYADQDNHMVRYGYYSDFIYDSYNNYYYRIYYLPLKRFDMTEWRKLSIMIFDDQLEKVHEELLPGTGKSAFFLLPSKQGLYIGLSGQSPNGESDFQFIRVSLNAM